MGKPRGQGRYAALGLAVPGLRTAQLSILLAGVLLAWGPGAYGLDPVLDVSQYAHTAWKIRDGFSKGIITSIAQTPDGYLLLGTEFGLLRFDGVRTVPWQPSADQHLPSNYITGLLVARDGTFWVGTLKGLASWKDGKLTQYAELDGQVVFKLLEDREGTVWAGGLGILTGRLCAIQKGSVQCHGEDGDLGHGVFGLYEDSKGNLWVGVLSGLWRWKPGLPKFYPLPGEVNGIQGLGEDIDGTLLVSMPGRVLRVVNGKTETTYPYPGPVKQLEALRLLRDHGGGLWIGTSARGLVHMHGGRTDVFGPSDGLSGGDVSALLEDREGSIWVATSGGLDRFRDFAVPTFSLNQGLSNAEVTSALAAKDATTWVGTLGGLNRGTNGQFSAYGKDSGRLNGHGPHAVFQDSRGRIWVSTIGGLGYLENDRFVPIRAVPGGATVHSIAEDTAGSLWIANQEAGLIQLSHESIVQQVPWAKLGHKDYCTALAADPLHGGLWLGFYNGDVAYFADGQVRASYSAANGLGEGRVSDLRLDPDGTLWAATEGGLSRLKDGRIATLTSKNGLPCDSVQWVMQDDDRSFWLNTACGLVRVARSEMDAWATAVEKDKDAKRAMQVTVFDSFSGVRSTPVAYGYAPVVSKSSDGKLWFLNLDGVGVVDPRNLPFNKLTPPVHIEQVNADRKTYATYPVGNGDGKGQLHLPPLLSDLEIDYTALSLVAPEKVLFRYKLEGWDRDWQDAGNRRQAFYTNLSPRKYRFRVMACNNSGVWNEAGTFLDFSVAPAYYQTTWFRLSCVAAFVALLWALYQVRLRQLARQFNAGLEARVNERTRIARELHDSLLQGFQGLMFRLQAVRDLLPGRASEAMQALDIALERGDKAIAEGRDTVSDLREPIMGDSDIAQALTALGKELALQSGNGLAPCVRVLLEGKQRELNPMLRDEIYRIAREALRNAFLHAHAQKIEAEITYSDSEFLLYVRDDGGGIDPEVANQGARAGHWGLPGMRERAKGFGGKLEVWSEHGAGTEIELSVPGAIAYGKSEPRRRFWLGRKKIGESDGQQS
jgi:signal transduction histidine kinase/ligand-binding sensor domain-containing protein